MMKTLKAAAVQYPLQEGLSKEKFFSKIKSYLEKAKAEKADLVVFPELIAAELVTWKNTDEDQAQLAQIAVEFAPQYQAWLAQEAQRLQMTILGGTTPRFSEGHIYNTAILALPDGTLHLQDKLFLTLPEKEWQWRGADELKSFKTPLGNLVIATCFDCEFPAVTQLLSRQRFDLLLVPSWTSTAAGLNRVDWTAQARAIEHHVYVVKTGTVPHSSSTQAHFGQASIITPQEPGYPLEPFRGDLNRDSIVYAALDLDLLKERQRLSPYFPALEQELRLKENRFLR